MTTEVIQSTHFYLIPNGPPLSNMFAATLKLEEIGPLKMKGALFTLCSYWRLFIVYQD